jgi:kynurenine formamidase
MKNSISIPTGRIVDLTHVLQPYKEQYTLEVSRRDERQGAEGDIMCTVYMWSHVGTHVEAPLHFLTEGGDTASIPVEQLMGPALVLDFRDKGVSEPGVARSSLHHGRSDALAGARSPNQLPGYGQFRL